jgi:hypothetical protein
VLASQPGSAATDHGAHAPARPEGAVAHDVPTLNVVPGCRSQSEQNTRTMNNCLEDEQRARDQLVRQWSQFAHQAKSNCTGLASNIAGAQSYVELLTCLQMAQDASKLPKDITQEGPQSIMGGGGR